MTLSFNKDLKVNEALRKELSKPFGKVMTSRQIAKSISRNKEIYAVGDVTVAELLKMRYVPKVAIFDYRTRRRKVNFKIIKSTYKKPIRIKNGRGIVSVSLWNAVRRAAASKPHSGIRVYGEEDLASLACIYFARKGSLVMYGLYGKGVAVITVDSKMKRYVARVLKLMM